MGQCSFMKACLGAIGRRGFIGPPSRRARIWGCFSRCVFLVVGKSLSGTRALRWVRLAWWARPAQVNAARIGSGVRSRIADSSRACDVGYLAMLGEVTKIRWLSSRLCALIDSPGGWSGGRLWFRSHPFRRRRAGFASVLAVRSPEIEWLDQGWFGQGWFGSRFQGSGLCLAGRWGDRLDAGVGYEFRD